VKLDTSGRPTSTASAAVRRPRSPRGAHAVGNCRIFHPTLRAGKSSSEVSMIGTPLPRTPGIGRGRSVVSIHPLKVDV